MSKPIVYKRIEMKDLQPNDKFIMLDTEPNDELLALGQPFLIQDTWAIEAQRSKV